MGFSCSGVFLYNVVFTRKESVNIFHHWALPNMFSDCKEIYLSLVSSGSITFPCKCCKGILGMWSGAIRLERSKRLEISQGFTGWSYKYPIEWSLRKRAWVYSEINIRCVLVLWSTLIAHASTGSVQMKKNDWNLRFFFFHFLPVFICTFWAIFNFLAGSHRGWKHLWMFCREQHL